MSPSIQFGVACAAYVIVAYFGFRHVVRACYLKHGRLPLPATLLQFLLACGVVPLGLLALADADRGIGQVGPFTLVAGIAAAAVGLVICAIAVATFRSPGMVLGLDASGLRTGGIYGLTRNPQAVGFGMFLLGFLLLWPTWHMAPLLAVFTIVIHLMVRTEEVHLRNVFGSEYEGYMERTPRYLWR